MNAVNRFQGSWLSLHFRKRVQEGAFVDGSKRAIVYTN